MSRPNTTVRYLSAGLIVPVCSFFLLISGCGRQEGEQAASQILAKVNGEEISVHQLNHILSRQPNLAGAPEALQKQVIEKLIDRQLAYQQAMKDELDRTPEVLLAIEEAKREIIASAYARKIAGGRVIPTEAEAAKYFTDNPPLFTQRKIYRLRELVLPDGAPQIAEVKAAVAQGQSLDVIANTLKGQGAPFSINAGTRAAEQLPIESLGMLSAAADGQTVVFESPKALFVYQVMETRLMPVDQATATPKIIEFLANQRANETVAAEMKRLREGASIKYIGNVAKSEIKSEAQSAPAPAPAPAQTQTAPVAEQPLSQDEAAKGVAGLK